MIFLINILLNSTINRSVQDKRYAVRYSFFKNHINSYNTLFFGSSRTLRHVIPTIFDSINKSNGIKSVSFNLGTPANKSFETYYQYEQFLNEYSKNKGSVDQVFLEVYPLDPLQTVNNWTKKSSYWLNLYNFRSMLKYLNEEKQQEYNLFDFRNYIFAFFNHYIGFNYLDIDLNFNADTKIWLGGNYDGYISYEDEIGGIQSFDEKQKLENIHENFLNNPDNLTFRRGKALDEFINIKYETLNKEHLKRLTDLLKKSKNKNIKLYFIIQPRVSSYGEMLGLKDQLGTNLIELANPDLYPQFWESNKSFNSSHMNRKGSEIFTIDLSDKFYKLNCKL